MPDFDNPGTIITFYSYKGGTGRSMAVANLGSLLARGAKSKVLLIDWDLEAPGLHRFFQREDLNPGVIDYFTDLNHLLATNQQFREAMNGADNKSALAKQLPLKPFTIPISPNLDLMTAGSLDTDYPRRIGAFDWQRLYRDYPAALTAFRDMIAAEYSYCLIDSRTGLNETSGICTALLPEKIVAVFTPNAQNLYGVIEVLRRSTNYRKCSPDFRPLSIFPLPSRVENAETELRHSWREQYQNAFEELFRDIYELEACNLDEYFNKIQLQHASYYAYGEALAVEREEKQDSFTLSQTYSSFLGILTGSEFPWATFDWQDHGIKSMLAIADSTSRPGVFVVGSETILGVMISSTFTDLEAHRTALIRALQGQNLYPMSMENDSAKLSNVVESSLQMVRKGAVYIGIITHKYGQVPEDPIRNPQNLSIVELEFNEAQRLGRPIVLFLMSDDHEVKPKDIELDPIKRDKLTAFKNRAKNISGDSKVDRIYATFDSLEDFRAKAIQCVAELRRHLEPKPPVDTTTVDKAIDPIPTPPSLYAEPRYLVSHEFIGRQAQLDALNDWAIPADPHPIIFFDAIGGTGKSMLTWHWLNHHAPKIRRDLAGRLWYSFYERGAQMSDFCRHALAYITGVEPKSLNQLRTPELAAQLLHHLQAQPWLLVLDGIERILVAYNRYDAAQLTDDQASHPTDEISNRNPTSAIRPEDDDLLRALATAAPSKIVITSRLVPQAFLNRAGQPIPGVLRLPLPGLRPADAEALFRSSGIIGDSKAIQDYLKTHCDCHPLVINALAGLVDQYRPDPGDFDAWQAHSGELHFIDLDLVQKRNHILKTAIAAVPPAGRRILSLLSLLSGSVDYRTLNALAKNSIDQRELTKAIADLESRGLLLYEAKRYDLHPVLRGVVAEGLPREDRNLLGQQVVDHFSSIKQIPYEEAESLEDVSGALHVVRTLVKMENLEGACDIYRGELSRALLFNLEAYSEVLSLLKPFFPASWSILPASLSEDDAGYLANEAALGLGCLDDVNSASDANAAALESALHTEDWASAGITLLNLGRMLEDKNKLAEAATITEMASELASAYGHHESIFLSLIERFAILARIGRWPEAQTIWDQLDPMGRAWQRATYRPGHAEYWYVRFKLWQGELQEADLSNAERLLKLGRDRTYVRNAHYLRGEWHLERCEWSPAATSFNEAVAMARAVGQIDAQSETQLALARFHLNQLHDPHHEADRLSQYGSSLDLAELYLALGQSDPARNHALSAYRRFGADGEPYVYRYYLNKSRTILEKLNVPVPNLPPYDPSKRELFPWEPAVRAAIAKLRAKKEEKARTKPAGKKKPRARAH